MSTKKSPSKPRRPSPKKADAKLVRENKELKIERDGLLEREAATSDILRMIARSPTDLQSVLDGIAERAARLCDAEDAAIFRLDGNFLRLVAHFGPIPTAGTVGVGRFLDRGTPAVVEQSLTGRRSCPRPSSRRFQWIVTPYPAEP
jgi:hypothetical protein